MPITSAEHHRSIIEGQLSAQVNYLVRYKLDIDIATDPGDLDHPTSSSSAGFATVVYECWDENDNDLSIDPFITEIDQIVKDHLTSEYNLDDITLL